MKPRLAVLLGGYTVAALVELGAIGGMNQELCTPLTGNWQRKCWTLFFIHIFRRVFTAMPQLF